MFDAKEHSRKYYQKNKIRINANRRKRGYDNKYHTARRGRLRDWVNTFKTSPCLDCGNTYPSYVMDFDHVRGKKKASVSMAVIGYWSKPRIRREIAKCDLVCSNCHRERTYKRRYGLTI